MNLFAWALVAPPAILLMYAYAAYPALLGLLRVLGRDDTGSIAGGTPSSPKPVPETGGSNRAAAEEEEWPSVSVSLPVHNEAKTIRRTLEQLLSVDYPSHRIQIVVVSDASTDGTDDIVRDFATRGVELLRLPERRGKTGAENAAVPHLTGDIVVNTDASVRVLPGSVKALIRAFRDPTVGLASGRDVSSAPGGGDNLFANPGEHGYVGYEMWVRSLETRVGSIVGASGCLYAIRREIHAASVPEHLSRDFLAAVRCREHGFRSVSVDDAVVVVPRTASLRREYRRKVRTMARGMETLCYRRHVLNPFRYGFLAFALWSHKVCRWLVPLGIPFALAGLVLLSARSLAASVFLGGVTLIVGLGLWALWRESDHRPQPRALALCGYLVVGNAAAVVAWWKAVTGERKAVWEPTRRGSVVGVAEKELGGDSSSVS